MRSFRSLLILAALASLLALWILLSPNLSVAQSGIIARLHQPLFNLGATAITLAFLIKTVLFLFILALAVRLLRRLLLDRLLAFTKMSEGQRYATARITGYTVYLLAVIISLQTVGLDLSSLAVFGGALGIGLGLGMQNVANNFVSGLILLIEHPIKVGDRVDIDGLHGDVERIGARSTWIRTNANVVIIVPNSEFTTRRVTNWTANDRRVRFAISVGVSYSSDPAVVRRLLLDIARAHPDVLDSPPPDVVFEEFGDSSLNFSLRVWTVTKVQTPQVLKSDLYFTIFEAFRTSGIEIPFPQRDLHIKSAPAALRVSLQEPNTRSEPG